ncbi:MAG: hypothetical protein R3B65_01380 [Candidatus Paceibacterota bacterium]
MGEIPANTTQSDAREAQIKEKVASAIYKVMVHEVRQRFTDEVNDMLSVITQSSAGLTEEEKVAIRTTLINEMKNVLNNI